MKTHTFRLMKYIYVPALILCPYILPAIKIMKRDAEPENRLTFQKFMVLKDHRRLNFSWTVGNQENCRYFEIEKSTNEKDFKVIALAFPFENNQDSTYYYYEKIKSLARETKQFYRIKALKNDFTAVYSDIVSPQSTEVFDDAFTKKNLIIFSPQ